MLEFSDGQGFEVDGLDADGVLHFLGVTRDEVGVAERRTFRLVCQWVVLHTVSEPGEAATWDPHNSTTQDVETARLGGEGVPLIGAFAPEELAGPLGVSVQAAKALIADVMDLRYRHRRLWQAVEDLLLPVWRARKIVAATRSLPQSAAAYVDGCLGLANFKLSWSKTLDLIDVARAEYDAAEHQRRERARRRAWGVWWGHGELTGGFIGSATMVLTGDALVLGQFHQMLSDHAETLARYGDRDPVQVRKVKALAWINDRCLELDLGCNASGPKVPIVTRRRLRPRLFAHIKVADLPPQTSPHPAPAATPVLAQVEGLGVVTDELLREWLRGETITITPVVDTRCDESTAGYVPPAWMREIVVQRDTTCVFPGCQVPARDCDLDHIKPYDPWGRLDQTRPSNLAPLCRRHHRAKTHYRWSYIRIADDASYHWRSPRGRLYVVLANNSVILDEQEEGLEAHQTGPPHRTTA
jgi:hypothetical protein